MNPSKTTTATKNKDSKKMIPVTQDNPDACSRSESVKGHDKLHVHGENCGHETVPHGDHMDYLVEGQLHHFHNDHCDNHGKVTTKN